MGKSAAAAEAKKAASSSASSSDIEGEVQPEERPKLKKEAKPDAQSEPQWYPKQLFVSGIPYEATRETLLEFFASEKDKITDIKMPTFQDTGRCIGYAHVTFTSKKSYESGLAKNKQKLGSRYLDVKEATGAQNSQNQAGVKKGPNYAENADLAESMPADCKTLFVKGLPYEFKEDDIGDRFRRFGEIKAIRIAYNWQTKQSKGFAYVTFETHESAKSALSKMNGKEVKGRLLKVDFEAKSQPKGSYKMNMDTEKNKLYNREPLKEERSKRIKKDKERSKQAKFAKFNTK